MFVVTVWFDLVPGQASGFLPLVRDNARRSLADEPGCRRFDVCLDPDAPDRCFLYEIYDDAAAFRAHCEASHFKQFDAVSGPLVVRKTVHILTLL
jgi:(4S)-4-hydroxy-5-phosphonooxypentane-2,3-dione isomerase